MTERLYYSDAYTTNFTANLQESTVLEDKPTVILDATYFYPTGGGQPHDLGTLNGVAVVDIQTNDQTVLHILAEPLEAKTVTGQIDWARRFDHMQNHTGQHILSRAFLDVLNAATVGFHLSENSVTIDLDQADLPLRDIDAVENLANQIIQENRAVRAWFPTPEELADLSLRKISDKVTGAVRVVDVGGFDLCACGGTHVAHTGEIGMIKIIRLERAKKATRIEFRCGGRALSDYREKNSLLLGLSSELTVGYWQVPEALNRLREENKTLQKEVKQHKTALLQYEAEALWQANQQAGQLTIIRQVWAERESSDLNILASTATQHPQTVALFGLAGEKGLLVFAASEDTQLDVIPLLKTTLTQLGAKGGGGRPTLAQGGGFAATIEQLQAVLAQITL